MSAPAADPVPAWFLSQHACGQTLGQTRAAYAANKEKALLTRCVEAFTSKETSTGTHSSGGNTPKDQSPVVSDQAPVVKATTGFSRPFLAVVSEEDEPASNLLSGSFRTIKMLRRMRLLRQAPYEASARLSHSLHCGEGERSGGRGWKFNSGVIIQPPSKSEAELQGKIFPPLRPHPTLHSPQQQPSVGDDPSCGDQADRRRQLPRLRPRAPGGQIASAASQPRPRHDKRRYDARLGSSDDDSSCTDVSAPLVPRAGPAQPLHLGGAKRRFQCPPMLGARRTSRT
ncbi:hypothetical protein T484DRAFT_2847280 [Baffinella frigidus]|nr:hypothetical protein T484DRAFT_2847280 [Cryptophyta sp. CCMP2293]